MYKTINLSKSDISSIIGCATNNYLGQVAIVPVTKRGMSNTKKKVSKKKVKK